MKFKTFGRHGKEGVKNITRNKWMSVASISAVTVTLLLVGVFAMLLLNLNDIGEQIEEDVEVRVFIDRTADEESREELQGDLEDVQGVSSVNFQSKDEGLDNLINSMGDEGEAFESLKDENPLNDVYVVKTEDPQDTIQVAETIEGFDSVDKVEYAKETVERLFSVMDVARNVGLAIIAGLLFTAMFLIANTIRITIVARKREIEIMKMVGATNWFIRWPFLFEGILIGILGSIIPIALVIFGYDALYNEITTRYPTLFIDLLPVYPFVFEVSALLVLMGVTIGLWGSFTSIRKYLKV
ncbi:FtsX-like permease family protein [Halobacillus litoralis]|uniref:Cell division protein FtsX n=1 Tax=Halobacillus litoralis TaxID=45668 RepID=A0A845DSL9_9BACI|nr:MULTISPECIES: permease-like cell division protein FtsX [Halobacillus]MCA1020675.1 permease-like cell division protein FtsX [Halobacillus litoralis]MYL20490.1 FtsX-like permease family protein [Halobacillus litoralis]MYL29582.1 FtsX-like permease family protein [Halobacillus halophilus]